MKLLTDGINFNRFGIFQIILVILIYTAMNSHAQQFYFKGKKTQDAIDFSLVKNLVIIPVFLNNKGPFNFILDTGVGPLIITNPDLIDSIGLKVSRVIKISGLGKGSEIDAYVSNDISAQVGQAYSNNIPTAILKNDIFGLSNYLGTKIYGLLGYYFFNSFVVQLKYSKKRLRFGYPNHAIKGTRIPIEMDNYKPYIRVIVETPELGRVTLKTLLDNGASHAVSLERLNEMAFPIPGTSIKANLGVGMSGPINGSLSRISKLQIGDFVLKNVLAAYPGYEDVAAKILLKDRNGNLGADVLSRFNVVFDYASRSLYLKKNAQFNRPFEHDMSGIELYLQEGKRKRYFISRIEPESPAEAAGLMVDDEILSINLSPASIYKLNEIDNLFKSSNGKTIIMTISRDKELIIKVFKLKQRI